MQKKLVLVCEGSLHPKKLLDVSGPGLGEAGRYSFAYRIDAYIESMLQFFICFLVQRAASGSYPSLV